MAKIDFSPLQELTADRSTGTVTDMNSAAAMLTLQKAVKDGESATSGTATRPLPEEKPRRAYRRTSPTTAVQVEQMKAALLQSIEAGDNTADLLQTACNIISLYNGGREFADKVEAAIKARGRENETEWGRWLSSLYFALLEATEAVRGIDEPETEVERWAVSYRPFLEEQLAGLTGGDWRRQQAICGASIELKYLCRSILCSLGKYGPFPALVTSDNP